MTHPSLMIGAKTEDGRMVRSNRSNECTESCRKPEKLVKSRPLCFHRLNRQTMEIHQNRQAILEICYQVQRGFSSRVKTVQEFLLLLTISSIVTDLYARDHKMPLSSCMQLCSASLIIVFYSN